MTEKYRNTPKGRIAPNGYRLCDPLPEGQILIDNEKKHWVIGKTIGLGGFGEIYLIYEKDFPSKEFVMKLDNINGPLFVEVNFVLRACQKTTINAFMEKRKLSFLGIPRFIASGTHQSPNGGYRFLIMERLGEELQKVLETRRLSIPVTCRIASRIIDVLEYIHDQGYIHADIKAQNILRSTVSSVKNDSTTKKKKRSDESDIDEDDNYYLIDYGLVEKYTLQGVHKPYEFDKRKANNGTCEFRSRDAHIGVISRRSDIESLGYNLILWFYGRHPWANVLKDADKVLEKKNWAMKNVDDFLKEAFSGKPLLDNDDSLELKTSKTSSKSKTTKSSAVQQLNKKNTVSNVTPKGLDSFFEEINTLSHDARPNYAKYKKILDDIAKLNMTTNILNGSPKKSRLAYNNNINSREDDVVASSDRKCKKSNNKTKKSTYSNDNLNNGDLAESDDTEIEDYIDSQLSSKSRTTTRFANQKTTPLKRSTPLKSKNKKRKIQPPQTSNRKLRNRIKIEDNDNLDDLDSIINELKKSSKSSDTSTPTNRRLPRKYSTTLMSMTPPDGGDDPLFGPFEPEDSISDNIQRTLTPNSTRANKKCLPSKLNTRNGVIVNDENVFNNDRRINTCRIYINNKRCRPRQSYDEDDLNGIYNYHPSSSLSTSTESLLSENGRKNNSSNMPNGKSTKSTTTTTASSSKQQNGSKRPISQLRKPNGSVSSSINSSNTASRSSRRNKLTHKLSKDDSRPMTSTPIAIKSTAAVAPLSSGVPETAAMQRIRMMIQNKKKK